MGKGKVHDLQNLKLAQTHSKNLKIIQESLHETVRALKPFILYKSVQKVLKVVMDELSLIEAHMNKFEKIEQSKGEVKEDEQQ